MIEDRIKEVEKAENLAAEIIEDAKKQAEEISLNIASEKEILRKKILSEASREAEKIRIQAISISAKKEEISKEETTKRLKEIEERFQKKKGELVDLIIERVKEWA
ncbi:MAG: hypothetical protein N2440_01390 [Actinobacteria bacterium]|nr:hypothetical protein [Actinomycetota bacterium]